MTRESGYWVAVVDGIPGAATEARTLARLRTEMVDLLAGLLDVDEDDIEVTYDYGAALGDDVDWLPKFRHSRETLERARRDFDETQRLAVTRLRGTGVSVRDAAALLGLSHQRVQQIGAGAATEKQTTATRKRQAPDRTHSA